MCEKTFYLGTKEYRGYMDGAGQVFINLTPNSIIVSTDFPKRVVIPQSGHVIKLIFNSSIPRVLGVPCSRRGVFFIVETAVKISINRPDFCVSVELDQSKEGVVLKPIFELE